MPSPSPTVTCCWSDRVTKVTHVRRVDRRLEMTTWHKTVWQQHQLSHNVKCFFFFRYVCVERRRNYAQEREKERKFVQACPCECARARVCVCVCVCVCTRARACVSLCVECVSRTAMFGLQYCRLHCDNCKSVFERSPASPATTVIGVQTEEYQTDHFYQQCSSTCNRRFGKQRPEATSVSNITRLFLSFPSIWRVAWPLRFLAAG